MTNAPDFRTEDLQLAAFLSALGFATRIEGSPQRHQFVFDLQARPRVADYYQVPAPVSAKDLFRHYRSLRGQMFRHQPEQLH